MLHGISTRLDMGEKSGMRWKSENINQVGAEAEENKSIRSSEKI